MRASICLWQSVSELALVFVFVCQAQCLCSWACICIGNVGTAQNKDRRNACAGLILSDGSALMQNVYTKSSSKLIYIVFFFKLNCNVADCLLLHVEQLQVVVSCEIPRIHLYTFPFLLWSDAFSSWAHPKVYLVECWSSFLCLFLDLWVFVVSVYNWTLRWQAVADEDRFFGRRLAVDTEAHLYWLLPLILCI